MTAISDNGIRRPHSLFLILTGRIDATGHYSSHVCHFAAFHGLPQCLSDQKRKPNRK